MTTVMHSSFAAAMGFHWPKELAYIINGQRVTWAQVKADRIARQSRILKWKRGFYGPVRHAAYVWTFKVEVDIPYGGWHLYIWALQHSWWLHWENELAQDIMRRFPCGLLPIKENFYEWKKAFAREHRRPGRFRQQGLLIGWIDCDYEGGWPQRFTELDRLNSGNPNYRPYQTGEKK
jgi:hypothetical protein